MKLLLQALLSLAVFTAASVHADAPDSEVLTAMLKDFLAGASVNDLDAHDRFWAEDLVYTSSSGQRFGKSDILERNAPSNDPDDEPPTVYTAEDIRINQYGDTAIVAFRLVGTRVEPGDTVNNFNTGTFLRRDGAWKAVAWQSTRIPEETERD